MHQTCNINAYTFAVVRHSLTLNNLFNLGHSRDIHNPDRSTRCRAGKRGRGTGFDEAGKRTW